MYGLSDCPEKGLFYYYLDYNWGKTTHGWGYVLGVAIAGRLLLPRTILPVSAIACCVVAAELPFSCGGYPPNGRILERPRD